MTELLLKWTFICSECEKFIVLKAGQKLPDECPHCNNKFDRNHSKELKSEDGEHTFLPPAEKYLNKLKDKF